MLLSPGAYLGQIAPTHLARAGNGAAITNRNLEVKIWTDRMKVRHAMVVLVNPDVMLLEPI